ncbi:MAG: PTS sugar transporter subunit IIA [Spirochaetia bacterium]
MLTIIVTGHGTFASGIKATVDLIFGETDHIEYIDFTRDFTPEQLYKQFDEIYENSAGKVIFLADLAGGTPFNQASRLLHTYGKMGVIGGINVGMVFAAIDMRTNMADPLLFCQKIKQEGIESIGIFGEAVPGQNMSSDGGI